MSEPIKYEIKYKQALVKGSAKAGRTARKCEPPAIPVSYTHLTLPTKA